MLKLAEFFEVPEGVEFKIIGLVEQQYKIVGNELLYHDIDSELYVPSNNDLNWFARHEIKIIPPKKTISEDEKVILMSLPSEFTWIARDKNNELFIFTVEPKKSDTNYVWLDLDESSQLDLFEHLFQCIKWEDEEATLIADLLKEV